MIEKLLKFSLFLLSIIDVNINSECQCDSSSTVPLIVGVIIGIFGIAVGIIAGLIVAVIMFKRMR